MAYQIVYDLTGKMEKISQCKGILKRFKSIIIVIGVIIALFWTAGGDWKITLTAIDTMAENLGQGCGLQEAFSDFCLDILQGT